MTQKSMYNNEIAIRQLNVNFKWTNKKCNVLLLK